MAARKQITYESSVDPDDPARYVEYMSVDGEQVALVKKPQWGKGYFLKVFGTKWQNAPGARYPQELDMRADYTYCRSRKQAEETVLRVLAERSRLVQR